MADDVSTRFPFMNLEKAMQRAEDLYKGDPGGKPMSVPTAFELWGYSSKSSGGFQTVGALKGYGLIEDDGANDERRVKLSDAARRYFLDERDDKRAEALRNFALSPRLFRALWLKDGWNEGVPADAVARSHLKIERKLSDQAARAVLKIFRDNMKFAGLEAGATSEKAIESPLIKEGGPMPPPEVRGLLMEQIPEPGLGRVVASDAPSVQVIGTRVSIVANVDRKGLRKLRRQLDLADSMLALAESDDEDEEADEHKVQ